MSKFDRIACFLSVIDENSFVAAGKKLGISTAAVSRQLAQLEASLGTSLVTRTTRRLALTEAGLSYYQSCKKVLSELSIAEAAIVDSKTEAQGHLQINTSRYFAMTYILPRLPEFLAANPKLTLDIEFAERFPDLASEKIDLIFGVSLAAPPTYVRKRVMTTRYVLAASPIYFKQHLTPATPADLTKHDYIAHTMRPDNRIIQFKNNACVAVQPRLWLNDSLAMYECALLGMGIVKLHEYIVRDALKDGRLIEILKSYQEPTLQVYLYYQHSKYLQPKIRRFIDFFT